MIESETCHTTAHELFEKFDTIKLLWHIHNENNVAIKSCCNSLDELLSRYPYANDLMNSLDDLLFEFDKSNVDASQINIQIANVENMKNLEWGI